jgi:hypothetical protein
LQARPAPGITGEDRLEHIGQLTPSQPGRRPVRPYKHAPHAAAAFGLIPQLRTTIASCEWLADVAEHTTTEILSLVGWPVTIHHTSEKHESTTTPSDDDDPTGENAVWTQAHRKRP